EQTKKTNFLSSRPVFAPLGEIDLEDLLTLINPQYLDEEMQAKVREKFSVAGGEIQLSQFLQPQNFKKLVKFFRQNQLSWSTRGPPNDRHVDILEKFDFPLLREFFQSDVMMLILSQLTGVPLHFMGQIEEHSEIEHKRPRLEKVGKCALEIAR